MLRVCELNELKENAETVPQWSWKTTEEGRRGTGRHMI
jgi:hypothetical protein